MWTKSPLLTLLALTACTHAAAPATDRTDQRTLKIAAFDRTYILLIPAAVKPDQPTPLVFAFHGSGGKGRDMLCCRQAAQQHGWLLVCPDGLGGGWFVGASTPETADKRESDRALPAAILADVDKDFKVDRGRVYACGFSGGGGMAARLGCYEADIFAAVAPVAHTLTRATFADFPPARPLSVMTIIGSKDPGLGQDFKAVNSFKAEEAVAKWAAFDGCGQPVTKDWPDRVPGDGVTVRETRYSGGKEGTEVVLLWLNGVGHTWLQGAGKELDDGLVIFDFFAQHHR